MAEPSFTQVAGTTLYWLTGTAKTIGFQATAGATLGDTPALHTTWEQDPGGVYFFLGQAPSSDAQFAQDLLQYLHTLGWPNIVKFLWIATPNLSWARWVGLPMLCTQSVNGWTVSRRADFRLQNYLFSVSDGALISLGTEAAGWGFSFSASVSSPSVGVFLVPEARYPCDPNTVSLPFEGTNCGCFRFSIALSLGATANTDFQRMGVGIRFFYPANASATAHGAYVRAVTLPTIIQPTTDLALDVSLDWLRPLVPERTNLSFFPLNPTLPAFESTLATALGYGVTLTPISAAGPIPATRLVFAVHPRFAGSAGQVPFDYYLTLQGGFSIGWHVSERATQPDSTGTILYRLLCGASGLEYVGVPSTATSALYFIPGNPAYAPLTQNTADAPSLTSVGTTAWVWAGATAPAILQYYAQPEDAPLYKAPPATPPGVLDPPVGSTFLDFFEIPALQLAAPDGSRAFPLAGFRGLPVEQIADAMLVEGTAIAPTRRQAILNANPKAWTAPPLVDPPVTSNVGVTPQGIAVGVGSDGVQWTWVGIANDNPGISPAPNIALTKATGAFRQALQTNRLFLVTTNADLFMDDASVAYRLTEEGIAELRAEGTVPPEVLTAVQNYFGERHYPPFPTEALFEAELLAASAGASSYYRQFEQKSGLLTAQIADWHFQLSPRSWFHPERVDHQCVVMVYKFAVDRSLEELINDVSAWAWSPVAAWPESDVAATQRELKQICTAARKAVADADAAGRKSPYKNFVQLLSSKSWTGILSFNVEVPLNTLPGPLQALAAGIDTRRFFAHHLGFNITPFGAEPGVLKFKQTSMFGLIDYQDNDDQYFEENIAFKFKVLQLTVGFRNSVMVDFSSRVELLINRMFGESVQVYPTDHGNNVILDGIYQRQSDATSGEHGTYVFSMERQNTLGIAASALRKIVLNSAQMVTTRQADPTNPASPVDALFQLGGDLHFYESPECDVYSFGDGLDAGSESGTQTSSALRFSNLAVGMSFTMADRVPTFTLVTERLAFDIANSTPRPKSLFASFPLTLSGFVATVDPMMATPPTESGETSVQPPDAFGYPSISAPIQQSTMTDPWFGIVYDVDLGTLGALAGSVGLTLRLLTAWSAGGTQTDPAMYMGVRLPGVKDALGAELPLQGVITLGFRSIELLVNNDEKTSTRGYMLRLRNFELRFFGLSFPPGYNDIYLFGNPSQISTTKLGWYAAYAREKDGKKKQSPKTRLLTSRRVKAIGPAGSENK